MFENFFPDFYFRRVEDIPLKFLVENNIKGLIFDMDNTLIDFTGRLPKNLTTFFDNLKLIGISAIIVTNSNSKRRVSKIAQKLNLTYIFSAKKPNLRAFRKAQKILKLQKNEIAIIGDNVFTDITGGKNFGIKTILIHPIPLLEIPVGFFISPLEIPIIIAYKFSRKSK